MKVLCNAIGSTNLCKGCGASVPHHGTYCEPCPINKEAKCIDVPEESDEQDNDFYPCDNCDGHDACFDFGCAIAAGIIQPPLF